MLELIIVAMALVPFAVSIADERHDQCTSRRAHCYPYE